MNRWQALVAECHKKFGLTSPPVPVLISDEELSKRGDWVCGELEEIDVAGFNGDLPGIADGIGDAIFFLLGTAERHGIDMDPVMDAIAAANMKKESHVTGDRWVKPPGWTPPDIAAVLKAQGWTP